MPNDRFAGLDAHQAARWVDVPAPVAFRHLADPAFVGRWALGCLGLAATGTPDVFEGTSLFDGTRVRVRIAPREDCGVIDYFVGGEVLRPRIMIRVVDGAAIGGPADACLVAMSAWHVPGTPPDTWSRTCTVHETEILLIKSQLESLHGGVEA